MRWYEIIQESRIDSIVNSVELEFPGDTKRANMARNMGRKELVWAEANLKIYFKSKNESR